MEAHFKLNVYLLWHIPHCLYVQSPSPFIICLSQRKLQQSNVDHCEPLTIMFESPVILSLLTGFVFIIRIATMNRLTSTGIVDAPFPRTKGDVLNPSP